MTRPRFAETAFALSGGGALGAFHAGVHEALSEAGIHADRLAGTSIGGVTAAIIAGNAPADCHERLRLFWDMVSEPGSGVRAPDGEVLRLQKALGALRSRLTGRPALFTPVRPRLFFDLPGWGSPSLYEFVLAPETLATVIDLERIAHGTSRLALQLTNLVTGEPWVVENRTTRIEYRHILAGMTLLPDFPPLEIDGCLYCDGGFSENLPLHAVLGQPPAHDLLCIAVDLLGEPGPPVMSLDGMVERSNDLLFANQSRMALALVEAAFRQRVAEASVVLILVQGNGQGERVAQKTWDYSGLSMAQRWSAGAAAGRRVVELLDRMPIPPPGLQVHRIVVPLG